MLAPPRFAVVTISNWEEIVRFSQDARGYVYRGQADADWPLATSIDRAMDQLKGLTSARRLSERLMLDEFKSKFHLYGSVGPEDTNAFEWLALLQHHGCPTRLLDFTFSIYVAAHFALSSATKTAAIWALNHWTMRDSLYEVCKLSYQPGEVLRDQINRHHIEYINACIRTSRNEVPPHLVPLEPTKASLRSARQQGLFLSPNTFDASFATCLLSTCGATVKSLDDFEVIDLKEITNCWEREPFELDPFVCIKMLIPPAIQRKALIQLSMMGLTEESLFPDIDGLARSLLVKHIRNR